MIEVDFKSLIALIVAVSGVVVAVGKHIMPVIMAWIGFKDKETKTADIVEQLKAQTLKLETNHIAHVQEDIKEIQRTLSKIEEKIEGHGNRLVRIETKLEK